jgi:hypothetical protein
MAQYGQEDQLAKRVNELIANRSSISATPFNTVGACTNQLPAAGRVARRHDNNRAVAAVAIDGRQ